MSSPGKKKFLIIGGDGFLGKALSRHLRGKGYRVVASSRRVPKSNFAYLNLTENNFNILRQGPFHAAFICAGVTSILSCEANPAYSDRVNVRGVGKLIRHLEKGGIFTVYLSSSCIFNGARRVPSERHRPTPTSRYGRQKVEIERLLAKLGRKNCVLRFGKICNAGFPVFFKWNEEYLENRLITAFCDFRLSPVGLDTALKVLEAVGSTRLAGCFNCTSPTQITYRKAFQEFSSVLRFRKRPLPKLYARNNPMLAKVWRRHSALNSTKLRKTSGIVLPKALAVIRSCAREFRRLYAKQLKP